MCLCKQVSPSKMMVTTVGTSHVHFTDMMVFLNFKCKQTIYQNPVHLLGNKYGFNTNNTTHFLTFVLTPHPTIRHILCIWYFFNLSHKQNAQIPPCGNSRKKLCNDEWWHKWITPRNRKCKTLCNSELF
jgi:hypothetical protein